MLVLLALAAGIRAGAAEQDFDRDAADGAAAVRVVAARTDQSTRCAANRPLFPREPGLWFDDDLVSGASNDGHCTRRNGNFFGPAFKCHESDLVLSGQGLASGELKHDLPPVDSRSHCADVVPSFASACPSIHFTLAISA